MEKQTTIFEALENNDVSLPTSLPVGVNSIEEETTWAAWLAFAETRLRFIEDNRKSKTAPINQSLKIINQEAKNLASTLEEFKEKVSTILSTYRTSDIQQEIIKARKKAESAFRAAEKRGDSETLNTLSILISGFNEILPKSIKASETLEVRYRSNIELDITGGAEIPEEFYSRVLNEKALKEAVEEGRNFNGVAAKVIYKPYCVEAGAE